MRACLCVALLVQIDTNMDVIVTVVTVTLFTSKYKILYCIIIIFINIGFSSHFASAVIVKLRDVLPQLLPCAISGCFLSGVTEVHSSQRLGWLRAGALLGGSVGVSSLNASD